MGKYMKVELFADAAETVGRIGEITGRRPDEVVSDALRTYLWILHQQTFGRKVFSRNGGPESERPVAHLVKDEKAARMYFDKMGW